MYKALIYKEWLKLRWTYCILAAISFLTLIYIAVSVAHDIEFNTAKAIWGAIIYMKYPFFSDIKYIFIATGVVMAIIQFFPEMNSDRLKLTLHLPVEEKKLLLQMISIGVMFIATLFLVILAAITIISSIHFPAEITMSALATIAPWVIAGLVAYLAVSTIVVEPIWVKRIELLIVFIGYIFFFDIPLDYSKSALLFLLVTGLFFSLFILISGYHFKRGIKS
jgi:hypothetical protein